MKSVKMLSWLCMAICCILFASCVDDESLNGAIKHPTENVEAIDLGLPSGTLWANCNIGAFDPNDYGDYFAWGETSPKKEFSLQKYWYYEITDYGYSTNIGTNIANTIYDAVIQQWGSEWCLPTAEEFEELMKYCTWTWIKYDDSVWGYKVEGKNGNWIFLPASGYYEESNIEDLDAKGGYWSGNLYNNEHDFAKALCFKAGDYCIDKYARYFGLSIRPVKNKNQSSKEDKVDFTYEVADSEYKLDYYVVSHIKFNNTSTETGNIKWYFGVPEGEYTADLTDINHPIVKYKNPGLYNVTLTIQGVGSRTYPILINDISPMLSISEQSMELVELNDCRVSFDIQLPNPERKVVRYIWTFPKDAKVNGVSLENDTISFYTDPVTGKMESPKNITFSNLGSQRITVDAIFAFGSDEERVLDQSYIDVHVASPIAAPTLYYAQVDGNIKAVKLLSEEELYMLGDPLVYPYDMGVSAGANPFNILYGSTSENDHWIYILDAGKQYYYINDEAGVMGDGKITAMRTDGTDVNVVISNVGGPAFSDPFQGCINDGYIYYNDRSRGFSKVEMTDRGLVEGINFDNFRASYVATNEQLGYYNAGIVYGAISNGLYIDNEDVFWWGKNYNGVGLYRFKESHVGTSERPYGVLLSGMQFTSYTLDETNKKLYVWGIGGSTPGSGLVEYPLPPNTLESTLDPVKSMSKFIAMDAKPVNTTADERVFVKQMVVDSRNGRVYFGFRAAATDCSGLGTGLVYYDPYFGHCCRYGMIHDEILGVTINPNATKLF